MSIFDKVMWLKRQRKIINVLQKDKLNGEHVYFYNVYIYIELFVWYCLETVNVFVFWICIIQNVFKNLIYFGKYFNVYGFQLIFKTEILGCILQMKCNIYFHLKRGLWTNEQHFLFSASSVIIIVLIHLCDASWHSDSSSSPLPVNLLHVLERALSHNPLKVADIPVAFSPFATFYFHLTFYWLFLDAELMAASSMSFCVFPFLGSMSAIVSRTTAQAAVSPMIVSLASENWDQ